MEGVLITCFAYLYELARVHPDDDVIVGLERDSEMYAGLLNGRSFKGAALMKGEMYGERSVAVDLMGADAVREIAVGLGQMILNMRVLVIDRMRDSSYYYSTAEVD